MPPHPPSPSLKVLAYAIRYIVWGSTYLAIRFAVETVPPFVGGSVRFLVAGLLMLGISRVWGGRRKGRTYAPAPWFATAISGLLLMSGANAMVVWSEQRIPSAVAALMVSTVPIWVGVLNWAMFEKIKPQVRTVIGALLGIGGIATLARDSLSTLGASSLPYVLVIAASPLVWTMGTLVLRRHGKHDEPLSLAGKQMLWGALGQFVLACLAGEWTHLDVDAMSAQSLWALGYLTIFGSIVAFTAFSWLVTVSAPEKVATYSLVNPVVAMILGALFAHEPITTATVLAMLLVIAGVALVLMPVRLPRRSAS